jgi:hypothetical protein
MIEKDVQAVASAILALPPSQPSIQSVKPNLTGSGSMPSLLPKTDRAVVDRTSGVPATTVTSISPGEGFAPAPSVPIFIGPVAVTGMFCWYQNSEYRLRLGVENLIEEPLIIIAEHGLLRLDGGEKAMTDSLRIPDRTECSYTIAVEILDSTPKPVFTGENSESQISSTSTIDKSATTTRRLTYLTLFT